MSDTDVLDRVVGPQARPIDSGLIIDLDQPAALPTLSAEALMEAVELERWYAADAAERETSLPTELPLEALDWRELGTAALSFGIDAACQAIAITAALLPRRLGKPIIKPMLRRIQLPLSE